MDNRYYNYGVNTSGIKEYRIRFSDEADAEDAYDRATDWIGGRAGIYEAILEDESVYIVCDSNALHRFLSYIERSLGVTRNEEV